MIDYISHTENHRKLTINYLHPIYFILHKNLCTFCITCTDYQCTYIYTIIPIDNITYVQKYMSAYIFLECYIRFM